MWAVGVLGRYSERKEMDRGERGGEERRNEKASTFLFFLYRSHKHFQAEWRFHGDRMPSRLLREEEAEEEEEVQAGGFVSSSFSTVIEVCGWTLSLLSVMAPVRARGRLYYYYLL